LCEFSNFSINNGKKQIPSQQNIKEQLENLSTWMRYNQSNDVFHELDPKHVDAVLQSVENASNETIETLKKMYAVGFFNNMFKKDKKYSISTRNFHSKPPLVIDKSKPEDVLHKVFSYIFDKINTKSINNIMNENSYKKWLTQELKDKENQKLILKKIEDIVPFSGQKSITQNVSSTKQETITVVNPKNKKSTDWGKVILYLGSIGGIMALITYLWHKKLLPLQKRTE
jgi:ATP phosphoribosyltransferase